MPMTPHAIGFPAECPNVVVPNDGGPHGGESCGGPVTTLADAVDPLRDWAEQNLKEVLNAQRRYDAARKDIAA